MRTAAVLFLLAAAAQAGAVSIPECQGIVRAYGDATTWMTSAFVIADGGWVVTTADAVTEKITKGITQPVRTAVFISAYTGEAFQCEVKAVNPDLNAALLRLPRAGLPSVQFARADGFSKVMYATLGQLMSGEQTGGGWKTEIHGLIRERGGTGNLVVQEWSANKAFLTDIGDYKWLFLSEMSERNMPSGSVVARGPLVVGMYLNRLSITGGETIVSYGRCAAAHSIAAFAVKNGVLEEMLYSPAAQTVRADQASPTVFQLNAAIYSFIGAGLAAKALEAASELVKFRPADAEAQTAYAIALTASGRFEDALRALDEAAKLNPKLPTLRLDRAAALTGLKKDAEAEAELAKALEERPNDLRAITAAADFYSADPKTLDKALAHAEKAVRLAPNSPAAKLLLARVKKRMKNYDSAIAQIEEAIKLVPNWPPAYYALGTTCEEKGDTAKAEAAYRKLVELQPKNPEALLTLAGFLADNAKPADALDFLIKLRELNPPQAALDAAKKIEDDIKGVTAAD